MSVDFGPRMETVFESLDFFLRPDLSRRRANAQDAPFDMKGATRCATPVISAPTTMTGRLPAEVVQSVVRSNYEKFRSCYDLGLVLDGHLAGRVAVRFVIERDGTVKKQPSATTRFRTARSPRAFATSIRK